MKQSGNEPLVSILTNTFNRADIIHRCIESVQHQSYANYEHIIVDGNSADNTEAVVRQYNDPHIKYIKLDARGPEIQMRAAFEASSGEYITFLDDDDEYLPEKIEKQVKFALQQENNVGLTYCWMTMFDERTGRKLRVHKPEYRGHCGDICAAYGVISGTPTLFVRRDVFSAVGGSFDDSIGLIASDMELVARIAQITDVDFLAESLVKVYENHSHARLSTNFYSEQTKRAAIFHLHFLNRFSDVFERTPHLANYHLHEICRCKFKLHEYREGFHYYYQLLKCRPTIKQIFKPLIGIVLNR